MIKIKINSDYITLAQLLKNESIIGSGGEAKYFLADYPAIVNGESENRRGRKLYPNDVIVVLDEEYVIE